jgi:hypothetical protein
MLTKCQRERGFIRGEAPYDPFRVGGWDKIGFSEEEPRNNRKHYREGYRIPLS